MLCAVNSDGACAAADAIINNAVAAINTSKLEKVGVSPRHTVTHWTSGYGRSQFTNRATVMLYYLFFVVIVVVSYKPASPHSGTVVHRARASWLRDKSRPSHTLAL